jgi:hypothetical protein
MLLILAALHAATIALMLFLLSSAVLAVVVTQVPLNALVSHTGVGGGITTGGLLVLPPPLSFLQLKMAKPQIVAVNTKTILFKAIIFKVYEINFYT